MRSSSAILSLTSDQTTRIENLFQSTVGAQRAKKAELDQQEDELSRLIAANADESVVTKQLDKVEATRSSLNKMRTLLIAPHPPGPLAGAADEAEPDSRSVGKRAPSRRLAGRPARTRRRQGDRRNRPHHVIRRAGMTRNGITTALLGIVVIVGGSTPAVAQTTDAHIQELIRAAAERIGAGQAAMAEPKQVPARRRAPSSTCRSTTP
mgnify:CR=1 FL=1